MRYTAVAMEQLSSKFEGDAPASDDVVIDLRTHEQPPNDLRRELIRDFSDDLTVLTRNLSMGVGLGARWSHQSRFRYTRPSGLEEIYPFSDHFEAEYIEDLGLLAQAGRDRIDGMFAFITPYHAIYDHAYSHSDVENHPQFVDTIELVARIKSDWQGHGGHIEVEEYRFNYVANFDRMMGMACDADFRQAVAMFVKMGEQLPGEQWHPLLTRAYVESQYWRDLFEMGLADTTTPMTPEEQERIANFLQWTQDQSHLMVES